MGFVVALYRRQHDLKQYHTLMAHGLGCMENALRRDKLQPRKEASLRVRLAGLLCEETENVADAEDVLSKGIILCDRNRLLDLKYTMHYLLAKTLFRTTPKAALKSLDGVIKDVEILQHTPWIYAFRFLHVSLSLQVGTNSEILSALQHLRVISGHAERNRDRAIYLTAAVFEAISHLKSPGKDSAEQARQAIAAARSLQLDTALAAEIPQVMGFLDCVDLICNLVHYQHPDVIKPKLRALQASIDQQTDRGKSWKTNSLFTVPLNQSYGNLTQHTAGIFEKTTDGQDALAFSWLSQRDLYVLGYYVSGLAMYLQDSASEKSSRFIEEGLKYCQGRLPSFSGVSIHSDDYVEKGKHIERQSLTAASSRLQWKTLLNFYMTLQAAFNACGNGNWESARKWLAKLDHALQDPLLKQDSQLLRKSCLYLKGVVEHGVGNLDEALAIFQSPEFELPENPTQATDISTNFDILALMNVLHIIHPESHPLHSKLKPLVDRIEPFCASHPNKSFRAGFSLLKLISTDYSNISKPLLTKKQHLQEVISAARSIGNEQYLAIAMNFMCNLLFAGIQGEQSFKSAVAARQLSKKCKSPLWMCVADGMLADINRISGKQAEAAGAWVDAQKQMDDLPPPLKKTCTSGVSEV